MFPFTSIKLYNKLVKKLLLIGLLCLFLGTATTIGVAWYCTIGLEWNHWSPVARGPTELDAPLWLVDSYKAPGFKLAHAWPILDSDDFLNMNNQSSYGYQPYWQKGPLVLNSWMVELVNPPSPENHTTSLKTIDLRGWPRPSMYRTFRTELSNEERLAVESRFLKSMNTYDLEHLQAWRTIRKELLQFTPLPLKLHWPGFLIDTAIYTGVWAILFTTIALFRILTKTWGFRRNCGLVFLFLISGVIATVGVSWSCSVWINVWSSPWKSLPGSMGGSGKGPTGWELWDVSRSAKPGLTKFSSKYQISWSGSHTSSGRPAEAVVPWWADDTIQVNDQDHHKALYGSGWPLHALMWWEDTLPYYDPDAIAHGGIRLSPWRNPSDPQLIRNSRALPLIPIWLGLIANTVFHSFCTFAIFAMSRGSILTRRWWRLRHKGLCPNCKYDLRELTSDKCPECGHQFDKSNLTPVKHQ